MSTTPLIIVAILMYVVFAVCNSQAGGRIDASLSSVLFNGVGALLSLGYYLALRVVRPDQILATRSSGLAFSLIGGVAIAAFSIVFITIYARGGALSYVMPTVYGGAIALTAIVGWVILRDSFSLAHAAGVAAIGGGLVLLALPAK
jgi:transporter family protein